MKLLNSTKNARVVRNLKYKAAEGLTRYLLESRIVAGTWELRPGAVAQRERASFARKRSGVRVPPAPPEGCKAGLVCVEYRGVAQSG